MKVAAVLNRFRKMQCPDCLGSCGNPSDPRARTRQFVLGAGPIHVASTRVISYYDYDYYYYYTLNWISNVNHNLRRVYNNIMLLRARVYTVRQCQISYNKGRETPSKTTCIYNIIIIVPVYLYAILTKRYYFYNIDIVRPIIIILLSLV